MNPDLTADVRKTTMDIKPRHWNHSTLHEMHHTLWQRKEKLTIVNKQSSYVSRCLWMNCLQTKLWGFTTSRFTLKPLRNHYRQTPPRTGGPRREGGISKYGWLQIRSGTAVRYDATLYPPSLSHGSPLFQHEISGKLQPLLRGSCTHINVLHK